MKVSKCLGAGNWPRVRHLAGRRGHGASANDQWFVLGEKTIKATDPSVRITAEEGKMWKEDIKKT